jgi:hypothetical protein
MRIYDFSGHLSPLPPGINRPLQISGKVCLASDVLTVHGELIKLAAKILGAPNMPLTVEDRRWYKSTPIAERRAINKEAEAAHEQCRLWAIEIKAIADRLALSPDGERDA